MKYRTLTMLAMSAVMGASTSVHAGELGGKSRPEPRDRQIVENLYEKFFKAHPDTLFQSRVVRLDDTKTGSIVVNFQNKLTCDSNGCLTNVLHYSGGKWHEVFSQHLQDIGFQGYSAFDGHNYRVITARGMRWTFTAPGIYEPDISSLAGTPLGRPVVASQAIARAAIYSDRQFAGHPERTDSGAFYDYPVVLNGVTPSHLVVFRFAQDCGQAGCQFVVLDGSDRSGYRVLLPPGRFFNGQGRILPPAGNWNELALQNASGIDFYRYAGGHYQVYRTTYPSPVTRAP